MRKFMAAFVVLILLLPGLSEAQIPGLKRFEDPSLDLPIPRPIWRAPERPDAGFNMAEVPIDEREEDPADRPIEPIELYGEEINPGTSIVFVIDRSGSMATGRWYVQPDGSRVLVSRWTIAVRELRQAIIMLDDRVMFSIVAYDHTVMVWTTQLMPADAGNKAASLAWLGALIPGGGTETGIGTVVGLSYRSETLALLTDGEPANAEGDRAMIRRHNTRPAPITVFGIQAITPAMRAFCANVAMDSGGKFVDVQN